MRLRSAGALIAAMLTASVASGYYHFVHFATNSAPYRLLYEKFDLNAIPDRTLPYFVSDPNGIQFSANDSFPALLSQIRAAAKVWNDVETSDLRLAFGGVVPQGSVAAGPSLAIEYDSDLPPGYVAVGGPVFKTVPNDTFVPIVRSVVKLSPNLNTYPTYSEKMFGTLVHEIGHALGLQHSFTSGAMSTGYTRATSKGKPLSADDVAAISILYPRGNFALSTGSISGRVTMSGSGVNLASVVAIAPNGSAIGALTNPDGTYRIDGLQPRAYLVYVHPLPPPVPPQVTPGDVVAPVDPQGREYPAAGPFETVFFTGTTSGTKDANVAAAIPVAAGGLVENINFAVRSRSGYGISTVDAYSAPASTWVKPPYLSPGIVRPYLVASGINLTRGNGPVPGLAASVLGGATLTVKSYSQMPSAYVQLDVDAGTLLVPTDSPRHVVFSAENDIYVLPSAFQHVSRPAPWIASLTPGTDGGTRLVLVAGTNFTPETRVLFDGVAGQVRGMDDQNRLIVVPPPAAPGHRAVVVAVNSDGQSSLFMQADTPPAYTYSSDTPSMAVFMLTPAALSPGMEAMLQIDSLNTNFTDGSLAVGFGSTDVVVRRIQVVSPTRAYVNVWVTPNAAPGFQNVTLVSGLQYVQQLSAFQIQSPQPRPFWLTSMTLNPITGVAALNPGNPAMMLLGASPVPLAPGVTTVLLNETRVPVTAASGTQITFNVPANFPTGLAVVRVESGGERSLPLLVMIEAPVRSEGPRVGAIVTTSSAQARSLKIGEIVSVSVLNAAHGLTSKITLSIGGKEQKVLQIFDDPERYNIFLQVGDDTPTGDNIPLVVTVDGRTTEPVSLTITK